MPCQARTSARGSERRAYERAARFRPRPSPGEPVQRDDALLGALRRLPARQRETVVLHYLLDMSVAQVARATGVAEGTVKTQLHRARETLRAAMTEQHDQEGSRHVG